VLELPLAFFEELLDRSPRLVSTRAAVRFESLIRASKLAKPLDEELDFEAALAIATSLTRTGERRRDFLVDGPWSGTSSAEEADEDTVAFRFPLRDMRQGKEDFGGMREGGYLYG
jgi:hypothetical protein